MKNGSRSPPLPIGGSTLKSDIAWAKASIPPDLTADTLPMVSDVRVVRQFVFGVLSALFGAACLVLGVALSSVGTDRIYYEIILLGVILGTIIGFKEKIFPKTQLRMNIIFFLIIAIVAIFMYNQFLDHMPPSTPTSFWLIWLGTSMTLQFFFSRRRRWWCVELKTGDGWHVASKNMTREEAEDLASDLRRRAGH